MWKTSFKRKYPGHKPWYKKKLRHQKYDVRMSAGGLARSYGIKFWHWGRNVRTGQRWRIDIWLGKTMYLVWWEING
jgi:hypothetical protein